MPRLRTLALTLIALLLPMLLAAPVTAAAGGSGWGWPLPPPHRVAAGFDPPAEPWLPGHRGVDLAGRPGEEVRAAGAGVVAFAGPVAGVPVVSIRHPDGLVTTYEPVVAVVSAGEAVDVGQRIGHLVRRGGHCLPEVCLHWGLRRDATYLDPLGLLGLTRVRLLPLHDPAAGGLPAATVPGVATGSLVTLVGGWLLRRRRLT